MMMNVNSVSMPLTFPVNVALSPIVKVMSSIVTETFSFLIVNVLFALADLCVEFPSNVAITRYSPAVIFTALLLRPLTVMMTFGFVFPFNLAVNVVISPIVKLTSSITISLSNLSYTLIIELLLTAL